MSLVGSLRVLFSGDSRGLNDAAQDAIKQLSQVQRHVASLSKSMADGFGTKGESGLGAFATKAVAAAGAVWGLKSAAGTLVDAALKADQLAASGRAVQSVFGDSAPQMNATIDKLTRSLALGRQETSLLAAQIGANLTNAGLEASKAADVTGSLMQRAADMSATFGGTAEEAAAAIGSALRGELDPIERYGVGLKAASVEAEALRMGATKVNGELSSQAKAMATVNLLMKQTEKLNGAAASQANTATFAIKQFQQSWDSLTVSIGQLFGPAIKGAADLMRGLVDTISWAQQGIYKLFGGTGSFNDPGSGPAAPVVAMNAALDATPAKIDVITKGLSKQEQAWERISDTLNAADSFQADLNRQFLQKTTGATDDALKLLEMVQGGLGADRARSLAARMDSINALKSPADMAARAAELARTETMRPGLALDGSRSAYALELAARTGAGRSAAEKTAKNTERTAEVLEKLLAAWKEQPNLMIADVR